MRGRQTFLSFLTVTKSPWCHPSILPLDLWQLVALLLAAWSVCCAAWLRALEHIAELCLPPSNTFPGWLDWCAGLERACPGGHKSAGKASPYLQRVGFSPWFTAPTETKLGTATVSAPGPLSGSQDELFAEDIQMYKEQIRLTQSSFACRKKREREPADFKKTSFPQLLEWVKGFGNKNSLVYSKC